MKSNQNEPITKYGVGWVRESTDDQFENNVAPETQERCIREQLAKAGYVGDDVIIFKVSFSCTLLEMSRIFEIERDDQSARGWGIFFFQQRPART